MGAQSRDDYDCISLTLEAGSEQEFFLFPLREPLFDFIKRRPTVLGALSAVCQLYLATIFGCVSFLGGHDGQDS